MDCEAKILRPIFMSFLIMLHEASTMKDPMTVKALSIFVK